MQGNRGPAGATQAGRGINQTGGSAEDLVGQATEVARNVADSASDLARDAYDTGARYVREGLDSLPDMDPYGRAVSRPIEQNPLVAILAAGAVGYLLAYLIHGRGETRSTYGRSRGRRQRPF